VKSSFEILSSVYQVIKPVIGESITGDVYIGHEPNDKLENVVINLITSPGGKVQAPQLNINISAEGINEHQADLARLKAIQDLIMPLVDDTSHSIGGENYHFDIADDKGTMKDQDIPGKFFVNLRVNCITV
jgi:hypothetical protein